MNSTNKLLDKYRHVCLVRTDMEAAKRLTITRATVSGWRHGKSHAGPEAVMQMCDAIGEPLRAWLPLIEAERASTPAVRKVWLRLAQAAASFALTFGLLNVQTIHAEGVNSFSRNPGTVSIMSNYAIGD